MDYFHNDVQAVTVSGLSFENGVASVSLHGSVTLTPDKASLEALRALSARLAELEKALVAAIDEGLSVKNSGTVIELVDNPFA